MLHVASEVNCPLCYMYIASEVNNTIITIGKSEATYSVHISSRSGHQNQWHFMFRILKASALTHSPPKLGGS